MVQAHTQGVVNVDLDLACMYELTDGTKGVVQPLGNFLGDWNAPPFVKLTGDDRFGSPSGETIYVNLDHKDRIKRLLFFVYIYDGTPAFDRTHAILTLFPSNGPRVEVSLDQRAPQARSCAVLLWSTRRASWWCAARCATCTASRRSWTGSTAGVSSGGAATRPDTDCDGGRGILPRPPSSVWGQCSDRPGRRPQRFWNWGPCGGSVKSGSGCG